MSDLEQLTGLIEGILTGSNEVRNKNEEILKNLRESDPNTYVMTFVNLLSVSPHKEARIFCAVHLRRHLSDFVDSSEESCWEKLTNDNHKTIKTLLWEVLNKEDNTAVRKAMRELVGEVAATVLNLKLKDEGQCGPDAKTWDDLMPSLWGLLSSNNSILVENALAVLSILFTYCMNDYAQYKEELANVFKQTLEHEDFKIKGMAIQAFASFLKTADTKDCKFFVGLIPSLLQGTIAVLDKDQDAGAEALSHITDIIEGENQIFRKNFRDLLDMLKVILGKDVSQPLKEGALESLTLMVENGSKFLTKKFPNVTKEIFETIFSFMVHHTEEATQEWLSPPEGFSENTEDAETDDYAVRFCMQLVDRLIVALGEQLALPILSSLLVEMMETNDWRYQFSALMALSQVGEYIENIAELDPIVKFIMMFTQNQHAKVRYSALHAIGQIADSKEGEFQERYLDDIFPNVITMLNDSVPRVVSHCCAAITNLLQKATVEVGTKYIHIWEPLLALVQNGISLVRESAMGSLACIIAACEQAYIPYWERTAEVVFNILKDASRKEYKQLRGQAIECLTVTGICVGKAEFMKIAPKVIETMAEIQQNHIVDIDPQKSYLLLGWERICSIMEDDFLPYVTRILPPVLELVEKIIKDEVKSEKSTEQKEEKEVMSFLASGDKDTRGLFYKVNTSESEEAEIAINLIKVFVHQMKEHYLPYLEKTSEMLTFLIDKSQNEDLRIAAADGLAGLIIAIKESKLDNKDEIVRKITNAYIEKLWESVKSEFDQAEDISQIIISMKKIILAAGRCLNEEEVLAFNENIIKVLKDSDTRKGINHFLMDQNKTEEQPAEAEGDDADFDSEEMEYLEEENNKEEELHCAIAELIGAMFQTYKELTLPLAQLISQSLLPKVLDPSLSVSMNKFGLLLVNSMLESLGIDLIQNEFQPLAEVLVKYASNKHAELREVAVKGIKLVAEVTREGFQAVANQCLAALGEALKMTKLKEESQKEFKSAKDHTVAALGQIIKSQLQYLNQNEVIQAWLQNLPLRHEETLARIQHELLVDLVLEVNATLVFGTKGENLPHVIRVFAEVLGTRLSSSKFEEKVGKIFQLLIENENTKGVLQEAVSKLEKGLQEKLNKSLNKA